MKTIKSPGITLLELLIAASLLLIVLTTVFTALRTGLFGYNGIQETIRTYQSAAMILERIDLDLRNAFIFSKEDSHFRGYSDRIQFLCLIDSFTQEESSREFAFLSYEVDNARLMRLCKKGKEALKEPSEIKPQEMTADIESLRFAYGYRLKAEEPIRFDKDSWDDLQNLPLAVKINLVIGNKTKRSFQRTVYLPTLIYE